MIIVSNAGPLIALARISRLDLLQSLYNQLHIPPAVHEEIVELGHGRAGSVEVGSAEWIEVVNVSDQTAVNLLREQLDAGESQAIVLAIELHADLMLIDEALHRHKD